MRVNVVIRQLQQALERLGGDAETQLDYMSRFGVGADEMALDFDDAFRTASGMVREGLMPESVAETLRPVDEILAEMTNSPQEEWTADAVSGSRTWSRLRSEARTSLNSLMQTKFDSGADGRQ